jgi:hypothetical protein
VPQRIKGSVVDGRHNGLYLSSEEIGPGRAAWKICRYPSNCPTYTKDLAFEFDHRWR